jgi:hypothetical protein
MERMLLLAGLAATAAAGLAVLLLAKGEPAARRFPLYGWIALLAMAVFEVLLALRLAWLATFFTAVMWTAYIAVADAAVFRRRGDSLLRHAGGFAAMAVLSVPAWLIFELYNLRLENWAYVGVPRDFWRFALGGAWAFATIFPGIFETADLIHCGWARRLRWRPWRPGARWGWAATGAVLLLVPLLAPRPLAAYLFALVWAGFIFLLEPVQRALGWPSLLADLEAGRPGRALALLLGGAMCGFFWEFWNFWAAARWVYVFPILHHYRVFAMPLPGFVGFPPFAIECFGLYVVLSGALLPPAYRLALLPESPQAESAAEETLS